MTSPKTVLILGGTSDIGRAIALRLRGGGLARDPGRARSRRRRT